MVPMVTTVSCKSNSLTHFDGHTAYLPVHQKMALAADEPAIPDKSIYAIITNRLALHIVIDCNTRLMDWYDVHINC